MRRDSFTRREDRIEQRNYAIEDKVRKRADDFVNFRMAGEIFGMQPSRKTHVGFPSATDGYGASNEYGTNERVPGAVGMMPINEYTRRGLQINTSQY